MGNLGKYIFLSLIMSLFVLSGVLLIGGAAILLDASNTMILVSMFVGSIAGFFFGSMAISSDLKRERNKKGE